MPQVSSLVFAKVHSFWLRSRVAIVEQQQWSRQKVDEREGKKEEGSRQAVRKDRQLAHMQRNPYLPFLLNANVFFSSIHFHRNHFPHYTRLSYALHTKATTTHCYCYYCCCCCLNRSWSSKNVLR